MDGLYDRDFLLWSEAEAEKLRRLRAGERVNDVDWENLIEEVEALGRSELKATESLLYRAVEHLLKVMAWPASRYRDQWMDEAFNLLSDAESAFTPAMRQRSSVEAIYGRALRDVRRKPSDGEPPGPLPPGPWFTLDDLLDENVSPMDLIARAPR